MTLFVIWAVKPVAIALLDWIFVRDVSFAHLPAEMMFKSALAHGLIRCLGESHNVARPSSLIGTNNFFELAVAAARREPMW